MKSSFTLVSMTTFYGGGEEYIVRLINSLEDDFNINIICCSPLLIAKIKKNKIGIHFIEGSTFIRYIKAFLKILKVKGKSQQVILLNGQGPVYFAPFLSKSFRKSIYVHHTSLEYYNSKYKTAIVIYCLQKVNTLICVSNFLKTELERHLKNKDIKVIYNWIPEEKMQTVQYNAFEKALKLIFIARLEEVKGILPLIEAVNMVDNVELNILGNGSLYEYIKSTFAGSAKVNLLGWQNNIADYLKKSHLNVVNSFSEGYSYTPVEAGVCGVPSLISDLDVHKEISDNGKFSFLFKTGSIEDLKSKLNYLQNNREELEKMSKACRLYYTKKFVFSDYKEKYIKELV